MHIHFFHLFSGDTLYFITSHYNVIRANVLWHGIIAPYPHRYCTLCIRIKLEKFGIYLVMSYITDWVWLEHFLWNFWPKWYFVLVLTSSKFNLLFKWNSFVWVCVLSYFLSLYMDLIESSKGFLDCLLVKQCILLHEKRKTIITFEKSATGLNFQQVPTQTEQQKDHINVLKEEQP